MTTWVIPWRSRRSRKIELAVVAPAMDPAGQPGLGAGVGRRAAARRCGCGRAWRGWGWGRSWPPYRSRPRPPPDDRPAKPCYRGHVPARRHLPFRPQASDLRRREHARRDTRLLGRRPGPLAVGRTGRDTLESARGRGRVRRGPRRWTHGDADTSRSADGRSGRAGDARPSSSSTDQATCTGSRTRPPDRGTSVAAAEQRDAERSELAAGVAAGDHGVLLHEPARRGLVGAPRRRTGRCSGPRASARRG